MKKGKISNTVLKRSVFKLISKKKNSLMKRKLSVGADYSASSITEGADELIMATSADIEPVINAVNNVALSGAKPLFVQCSIVLPENYREIRLKEIMERINADCSMMGVELTGGSTLVGNVTKPVITATAAGYRTHGNIINNKKATAGLDIVMTKWVGISGIQRIITEKRQEILERYTETVIEKAYGKRDDMSVLKETEIAIKSGATNLHDVATGGVFAALWDMSEHLNTGIEVDFRAIPVCQETIEICEMYDVNPYLLASDGCLLMTTEPDCDTINLLREAGIPATVIGHTTDNNDKIIRNLEETRYLDVPQADEIYRFI